MKKIILYIIILISITSAGFIIPVDAEAVECTPVAPERAPSNTPEGCVHTVSVTISPTAVRPGSPATIAIVVTPDPTDVNTTINLGDNDDSIKKALSKTNLICPDTRNTPENGPQCLIAFIPTAEMVGTVNIKYSVTVNKVVDFRPKNEPTISGTLVVQVDNGAPTSTTKANVSGGSIDRAATPGTETDTDIEFGCSVIRGRLIGCAAQLIYHVLFVPASFLATLAAKFLDFFVYYSTNSNSYDNKFVSEGWGAVRDVANIFFIIALLYIAIKTILNLEGSHTKKLIANIIVIALIINFSLFTTRVVIDASNILAKVFYNSITSVDSSKTVLGAEKGGEKSISVGLVQKFNPQKIVTQEKYSESQGKFIFLTLLLVAITLYTSFIFFSVALLFVGRVASLWISMIFAPLAFISYTVPFDIPGFGHKRWWDELLKNAFLAPLFIFFLYIIILFTGFLTVAYPEGEGDLMQSLMSVIIPFIIIVVLLQKSKKLATEYAGDMGKAVISAGKMVGGMALGATAGAAGMAGRNLIGRQAANLAESNKFRDWAAKTRGGQFISNRVTGLAGRSFDVRGASIAGKDLAGVTGMNVGKAKEGGFIKARMDSVKKQEDFVKKQIDTSEHGKAELTRGKMDKDRAIEIQTVLQNQGMLQGESGVIYEQLIGNGLELSKVKEVSAMLDAERRNKLADRIEKRAPGWKSEAKIKRPGNATKRMLANRIRSSAGDLIKKRNQAHAFEEIAHAIHESEQKTGSDKKKGSGDKHEKPADHATNEPAHSDNNDGGGDAHVH